MVAEAVFRLESRTHSGGVGKQLEGGAGRAQGLGGAIELAGIEVFASHQGAHQARTRFHGHQGALETPRCVLTNHLLGFFLPVEVEAGSDVQTTHLQLIQAEDLG